MFPVCEQWLLPVISWTFVIDDVIRNYIFEFLQELAVLQSL